MKSVIFTFGLAISLAGCVKLNLLPDGSVKQSIHATKKIISESRLKKSGGVKITYSQQESMNAYASRDIAEEACLKKLNDRVVKESPYKAPLIISDKMGLAQNNHTVVECSIEAYVWPKG